MSAHRYSWFGAGGSPKVEENEKSPAHGTSNARTATPNEDYADGFRPSGTQVFPGSVHDGKVESNHDAQALAASNSKREHKQSLFPATNDGNGRHMRGTNHSNALELARTAGATSQPCNFMTEGSASYPHAEAAMGLAAAISKRNRQTAAGGTTGTGGQW